MLIESVGFVMLHLKLNLNLNANVSANVFKEER